LKGETRHLEPKLMLRLPFVRVLQVGVDPKAVADAWMRIEKKHGDKLAALFVSVDESKGKALAYAGGCPRGAVCVAGQSKRKDF
jgi:hypothetical protein